MVRGKLQPTNDKDPQKSLALLVISILLLRTTVFVMLVIVVIVDISIVLNMVDMWDPFVA